VPRYTGSNQDRPQGPRALQRRLAWMAYLAIIVGVCVCIYWLRGILLPFIIALLIAFIFEPIVTRLQRHGLARWLGVIAVYTALVGLTALFLTFLVPIINVESQKFFEKLNVVLKEAPKMYDRLEHQVENFVEGAVGAGEEDVTPIPDSGKSRDEDWGFGPAVHKIPTVGRPSLSVIESVRLGASNETLAELGLPPVPDMQDVHMEGGEALLKPAGEPAEVLTVEQVRPMMFSVRLGQAQMEVQKTSEGSYLVSSGDSTFRTSRWGDVKGQVVSAMRRGLQEFSTSLLTVFFTFFQGLVAGILDAIVGLVVVFLVGAFIMIDGPRLTTLFRANVPGRYRSDFDELLYRLDKGLSGVVRGQIMICLVNGFLSFIGFWIFIPEYSVVLGILAGVMSLIPIFGTIISSVPAILVALSISFGHALGVLAWISGIHFVEAYILNPNIIGKQARMHPVVVVFVLIAGEALYGMKGILLAVPVTSGVQSVVQFAYARIRKFVL
jgi:predicted PurR-regulated permease PerM